MRIDVVTIFPDYLAPLALSLPGKAVESGLLDLRVHDLRDWTHDRHRTVDDTPYGGGAGMVMKPEPWGEALDALLADGPAPRLLVMTPSGRPFSQADAERLSHEERLAFACGRYEGIDARVIEWAREHMAVEEISLGDYVLNGGEVAAMVCIEAIARLVPGFLGNPESIIEESHSGDEALLEHPAYTKPPVWRGHDVPAVLLSGDHGRIARWRSEQSRLRTRRRRPDLYVRTSSEEPLPGGGPSTPTGERFGFEPLAAGHAAALLAAWSEAAERVLASPSYRRTGWPLPLADADETSVEIARLVERASAGVELSWVARRDGELCGLVSCVADEREAGDGEESGAQLRWWTRRACDAAPLRRELAVWAATLPCRVRVPRR